MSKDTPVADDVDTYLKGVQERQDLRNEAAGVTTPGTLPEVLTVSDTAGPTTVTITAPAGTKHHHLLTELIEHLKALPAHVQITETSGQDTTATATDEAAE
jgi:hypothetical protein